MFAIVDSVIDRISKSKNRERRNEETEKRRNGETKKRRNGSNLVFTRTDDDDFNTFT